LLCILALGGSKDALMLSLRPGKQESSNAREAGMKLMAHQHWVHNQQQYKGLQNTHFTSTMQQISSRLFQLLKDTSNSEGNTAAFQSRYTRMQLCHWHGSSSMLTLSQQLV
jgi:hypothetical protein